MRRSFREQDAPEAVLTLHDGQRFPYATTPASPQGVALPDGGVATPEPVVFDRTSAARSTVDVPAGLRAAAAEPATAAHPGDASCTAGDRWCADSIVHRATGGITHDEVNWQNRPTYQQAVQFPARRRTGLAAGATATAGSHERGWFGSPPSNAVDGKADTRWAGDWSDPQWSQVDLGATRTVGRVVLAWEAAYAKGYRIELSTDGVTWQTACTTSAGNGGQDVVAFPPARRDSYE